ncbi:MAG: hypothetical protein LBH39_06585, partial [Clostridiales Family XIII bacterium]|nr:hypothetical protein [Clostridiales Family XIII bacterium]
MQSQTMDYAGVFGEAEEALEAYRAERAQQAEGYGWLSLAEEARYEHPQGSAGTYEGGVPSEEPGAAGAADPTVGQSAGAVAMGAAGTARNIREVATFEEFRNAVRDDSVAIVELNDDIVIEKKMDVTRKNDLIIDGKSIYRIVEYYGIPYAVGDYTLTFRGTYKNIVFQNLGMQGMTYGASVYAPVANATVSFINVSYRGPALYYGINKGNTCVLRDCEIVLDTYGTKATYTSEVVHGYNVEMLGTVNIVKRAAKGDDHDEIFYLSEPGGDLIVGDGAVVNIENKSKAGSSRYWSGLVFAAGGQGNTHKLIVGKNARFSYTGIGGCVVEEWPLEAFEIGEGAVVEMTLSVPPGKTNYAGADNGAYFSADKITLGNGATWDYVLMNDPERSTESMLGVGELIVGQGANLRVKAPKNTHADNLVLLVGPNPKVRLDRPGEVLFYNGNRAAKNTWALAGGRVGYGYGMTNAGKSIIEFTGGGISVWPVTGKAIGINGWDVENTATMRQWGVKAGETFSLRANMGYEGDISNLTVVGTEPAPAGIAGDLKTFKNMSVIRFEGEGARQVYAKHYLLDGEGKDVAYFEGKDPLPLTDGTNGAYDYDADLYLAAADGGRYCFDEVKTQEAGRAN